MCLDPVSPVYSAFLMVRIFWELQTLKEKWNEYRDSLTHSSTVISDLDLDRERLSLKRITGSWEVFNDDIAVAKSALESGGNLVGWSGEHGNRVRLRWGILEFALKQKAATANRELLDKCLVRLEEIRQNFIEMDRNIEVREAYLRATRERTNTDLAMQYTRRQHQQKAARA
jgi:hypothetical protein